MRLFENESECLILDGLTVENRVDRVSVFGSLDITRDKVGLLAAKQLKAIFDDVVNVLEGVYALPDKIEIVEPVDVKNPFK